MKAFADRKAQFMERLRKAHLQQHLEHLFLYHAAPVLRGAKPAALVSLRHHFLSAWRERHNALRKATNLQTLEIENNSGSVLLLIYDESSLERHLSDPKTSPVLAQFGYPAVCDMGTALERLKSRFSDSRFPHEIGVFLGYPPEDVCAFIEHGGKDWLCCRHWKVYHDEERALSIFKMIDEAHSRAMDILQYSPPLHVVVELLQAT